MSYRRDKAASCEWTHWVISHRKRLLACGVPSQVFEKEQAWRDFLDHGYYSNAHGQPALIDVDEMPDAEALALCVFLEEHEGEDCSTLGLLQFRFKRGSHSC